MALEIQSDNGQLNASLEPFMVKIITNNTAQVETGGIERFRIVLNSVPAVGSSFSFTFDGDSYTVEMVSGSLPLIQPSGFPSTIYCPGASSGTIAEYIDNLLIPSLLTAQVFEDFVLSRSGSNAINFWSRTNAENRFDDTVTSSGFSLTASHLLNGDTDTVNDDFQIKLKIIMESSQNTGFFDIESPWFFYKPQFVGDEVYVETDIREILHGMMNEVDVISSTSSGSGVLLSCRGFRILAAEHFGTNPQVLPTTVDSIRKLLKGGRREFDSAELQSTYSGKFLTLRKEPWVDRRLNDWLYFFEENQSSGDQWRMRATVKGAWGTSAGANYNTINMQGGVTVHMVPCGYNQLNLQALLGDEEPVYYDIEIYKWEGGAIGSQVIETFRFYVNPESETRMGIHYFNFLGLMEAQVLDATTEFLNAWENDTATNVVLKEGNSTGSGLEVHRERALKKTHQLQINTNTGPLSAYNWMAAQDILNSERVWLVNLNEGVDRMAATVVKGSEKMTPYSVDGVNFHGLGFSIKLNKEKGNSVPERLIS